MSQPRERELAASANQRRERHTSSYPLRFVTSTALFDGHDASINLFRQLLQASGAEVIHLGHNRSAEEIVTTAIHEDVQGIAISSYQGGHNEFFSYVIEMLREGGAEHVQVFGGGGGVILPEEIEALQASGVARIYSPRDGHHLGLDGIVNDMLRRCDFPTLPHGWSPPAGVTSADHRAIAQLITFAELQGAPNPEAYRDVFDQLRKKARQKPCPVLAITGPGGAGKSSLLDELIRRLLVDRPDYKVAVFCIDPSKRKTGGALLGDRLRMNAIYRPNVYVRSLATRGAQREVSDVLEPLLDIGRAAGFDLIVVETTGTGQRDSAAVEFADVTLYVMTSEYGAPTQLEKIDMLDWADLVAVNKIERRGAEDALREVRKVYRRARQLEMPDEEVPVFGTSAAHFDHPGVNQLYAALNSLLATKTGGAGNGGKTTAAVAGRAQIIPARRQGYLGEIAATLREHRQWIEGQAAAVRRVQHLAAAREVLAEGGAGAAVIAELDEGLGQARAQVSPEAQAELAAYPELEAQYAGDELAYEVRDRQIRAPLVRTTLSGTRLPRVVLPRTDDWGDRLRFLFEENVPGRFPYTAGVFPVRHSEEDPTRMFAGEGGPERTNRRFHYVSQHSKAKRLSVAFDSVTLYGEDPAARPDILGKIGESGVSIATFADMKRLFAGFDLSDPNTSVSMTINGPAPTMLAFFLNTAIDQAAAVFADQHGRTPTEEEAAEIRARVLRTVRGTVQADILKEEQAQNTCIFSTDFALRLMGDVQEYFIANEVRNYYSVSISGYHIAEAGANPITQLAFTLANGFTYCEYYLSRGMSIDEFAPNLSFFFSNGLDAEYSVIGRVARRIWSRAMKLHYGANERGQKLKYHIQTSGRSLHAMEISFNDIRTTLQALLAINDSCNSLHTNAYDEAITTPTEESVRRALAIQLIVTREFGLSWCENVIQGSYALEHLTDLVEEAVLAEFDRLNERGGVLGAADTNYQRARIQEESLLYETRKHSGELPIIGVNTFLGPDSDGDSGPARELSRTSDEEKRARLDAVADFKRAHAREVPAALKRLKEVALSGGNIFAELMTAARVATLGQLTATLYEVGGRYRRNM